MIYQTSQFSYDKASRTLSGFASDLPATDNEVQVQSSHTNRIVTFKLVETHKDWEGDTISWTYRATDINIKLTIWND